VIRRWGGDAAPLLHRGGAEARIATCAGRGAQKRTCAHVCVEEGGGAEGSLRDLQVDVALRRDWPQARANRSQIAAAPEPTAATA
jgi:hypothetical protein